jgi:hypothetical protein
VYSHVVVKVLVIVAAAVFVIGSSESSQADRALWIIWLRLEARAVSSHLHEGLPSWATHDIGARVLDEMAC